MIQVITRYLRSGREARLGYGEGVQAWLCASTLAILLPGGYCWYRTCGQDRLRPFCGSVVVLPNVGFGGWFQGRIGTHG